MRMVIAGGGLAGQRSAEALRRQGHDGPITMVCAESHLPYDRPPLSKELLAGTRDVASLTFRDEAWYRDHEVDLRTDTRAEGIDLRARRLLTSGGAVRYDRLLVATGARARTLPFLSGYENVHVIRDVDDALALRDELRPGARLVIVGAGFVGLEVASTARALGAEVVVLEAASTPLSAVIGERLGRWFARLHRRAGVGVVTGVSVARAIGDRRVSEIALADGRRFAADAVLVAIGAGPDTAWLGGAGLPADGVPTGPLGNTAAPGIYAAGDAARPVDPVSGALSRQEHWEAAARGGAQAARGMLGLAQAPEPPSSFWSDQHGMRIQLVGHTDGADRTTVDGEIESNDFSFVWHRAGKPIGVLLANRPHELPDARRLVAGISPPERTAA